MKNMLIGYIDRKAISLLDTLYISKLDTIYLVKTINTVLHDDNSRWWILSILSYLDNNDLKRITC
ncbi:ankyrin repeat protein [Magpiepox virus]|nr:ankyrin repeat protein [Magpiepox virus]